MRMKEKEIDDLEERLLDAGDIKEPLDVVIDRILETSDKKKRRYALG